MLNFNVAQFIFPAAFSFLISLSIGYIFCKISLSKELYDFPNTRKIHQNPTPRMGGFVIIVSLVITSLLFGLCLSEDYNYYLILCMAFFLIGLMDDIFDWNYKKKLIAQFMGVVIFFIVFPFDTSKLVFTTIEIQIPWLNYLLLILWILAIINSFNFFDGINCLAGSLAIVFFASYGILYYNNQSVVQLEIYLILIFSILGFLIYNRTPAKMFLGDSGSIFIGFLVATLPLHFASTEGVGIDVSYPVIITSILIMETVYLILSRIKNKKSPFYPDKLHLHHQLLNLNLKNRYVVLIISFSTILLSILAYFSRQLVFYQVVMILLLFFGIIIVLPRFLKPRKLHY